MRTPLLPAFAPSGRRGFALVATTILMGFVLAFGMTLLDTSTSSRRAAKRVEQTANATHFAEAGVNKALYCLKATSGTNCGGSYGMAYAGETGVAFGSGAFTVAVTGTGSSRTITSTGTTAAGVTQTIKTQVSTDAPSETQPGFDYAIQTSDLGVALQNNAEVNGVVYTDSDVICGNNAEVNYDVYVSRSDGKIENCLGILDARADRVLSSTVLGDAYYRLPILDILGTSVAGTKHPGSPTPPQQAMPTFDKAFWEDVADSGGTIYGDYSVSNNQAITLGPARIVGNVSFSNNVTVTLEGPVWIEGNLTIGNNVTVQLAAGFGPSSGVIIADKPSDTANGGVIDISNNASVLGSGTDGSYLVLYTTNARTSDTDPAIKVANNASGGIFYAPNGSIRIHENGGAVAAIGRRVSLDNNAVITYDNTGTTPASMTIATAVGGIWRFIEDAWRQFK